MPDKCIVKEVDLIYWIYWIIVPWSQCIQKTSAPPGSRRGWQSRQRPTCLGKSSSKDIQLQIFDIFGGKKHHRSWKSIPGLSHWPKMVSQCFTYHISCYQVSGIRYRRHRRTAQVGIKCMAHYGTLFFPIALIKSVEKCWNTYSQQGVACLPATRPPGSSEGICCSQETHVAKSCASTCHDVTLWGSVMYCTAKLLRCFMSYLSYLWCRHLCWLIWLSSSILPMFWSEKGCQRLKIANWSWCWVWPRFHQVSSRSPKMNGLWELNAAAPASACHHGVLFPRKKNDRLEGLQRQGT